MTKNKPGKLRFVTTAAAQCDGAGFQDKFLPEFDLLGIILAIHQISQKNISPFNKNSKSCLCR